MTEQNQASFDGSLPTPPTGYRWEETPGYPFYILVFDTGQRINGPQSA